tara:strand:+ start:4650 stop:4769 length:120 start_codon:yes stop_codon:yes gene_type:complete
LQRYGGDLPESTLMLSMLSMLSMLGSGGGRCFLAGYAGV